MPDVKEFHFHMELLVQMDIRRHGMAEGARMTFFHSGQLRPLGGAHFPLPRAANERGGDLWHLGGALRGRIYLKSIPDGWKKCSLEIDMGGLFARRREISWKSSSPMKITWVPRNLHFVLEFTQHFSSGLRGLSGEVIGSLPGSCRIPWNSF